MSRFEHWIYFIHYSIVSVADFQAVNAGWEGQTKDTERNRSLLPLHKGNICVNMSLSYYSNPKLNYVNRWQQQTHSLALDLNNSASELLPIFFG